MSLGGGAYAYSNEFTVAWRDPKDCVVSYDANGGSGGMSAQVVKEGDSCPLGACTITPPVGWGFQNWEVNGGTYSAYTDITVKEDTTVKAVWENIPATPTEYDILELLMRHPGQVFSPRDIYTKVWDEISIGNESTVAVHIRHLREKIEIDPANPRFVKVVWGRGYKLENGWQK